MTTSLKFQLTERQIELIIIAILFVITCFFMLYIDGTEADTSTVSESNELVVEQAGDESATLPITYTSR